MNKTAKCVECCSSFPIHANIIGLRDMNCFDERFLLLFYFKKFKKKESIVIVVCYYMFKSLTTKRNIYKFRPKINLLMILSYITGFTGLQEIYEAAFKIHKKSVSQVQHNIKFAVQHKKDETHFFFL